MVLLVISYEKRTKYSMYPCSRIMQTILFFALTFEGILGTSWKQRKRKIEREGEGGGLILNVLPNFNSLRYILVWDIQVANLMTD